MPQNKSLWSSGEEDIPICLSYLLYVTQPRIPTRHLSPPSICPSFIPDRRCLAEVPPLPLLSLWVQSVGGFGLFYPDVPAVTGISLRMAAVAQPSIGSFFSFSDWFCSRACSFVALRLCVIHISHVSCPKQHFTVVNEHPCHRAGISPFAPLWSSSWGRWPHQEVTDVSPGLIFIIFGTWLQPPLFQISSLHNLLEFRWNIIRNDCVGSVPLLVPVLMAGYGDIGWHLTLSCPQLIFFLAPWDHFSPVLCTTSIFF